MAIFNSNGQIIDTVNEKAQVTNPIALEFDSTASYNVGDYVSYNGSIYKCNTEIATDGDGSWIAGHWDEVKVGDEISDLKEDLNYTVNVKSPNGVAELGLNWVGTGNNVTLKKMVLLFLLMVHVLGLMVIMLYRRENFLMY